MILLKLFLEFSKIGLFSVGGGLATIPFLQRMSEKTNWFTRAQLADMIAVSESTPGPIGVNMATYVGYTVDGVLGSIVATIGLVTPPVIIVLIVGKIINSYKNNEIVQSAFYGIRPASTGLIASAAIGIAVMTLFNETLYKQTGNFIDLFNFKSIIFAVVLFIFTRYIKFTKNLHPIIFIGISAVIGILLM